MSWIRISDLTTGEISLPKDAIVLPTGVHPPANYKFAYTTLVPFGKYISGQVDTANGADLSKATSEPIEVERHVFIPYSGDEA